MCVLGVHQVTVVNLHLCVRNSKFTAYEYISKLSFDLTAFNNLVAGALQLCYEEKSFHMTGLKNVFVTMVVHIKIVDWIQTCVRMCIYHFLGITIKQIWQFRWFFSYISLVDGRQTELRYFLSLRLTCGDRWSDIYLPHYAASPPQLLCVLCLVVLHNRVKNKTLWRLAHWCIPIGAIALELLQWGAGKSSALGEECRRGQCWLILFCAEKQCFLGE